MAAAAAAATATSVNKRFKEKNYSCARALYLNLILVHFFAIPFTKQQHEMTKLCVPAKGRE